MRQAIVLQIDKSRRQSNKPDTEVTNMRTRKKVLLGLFIVVLMLMVFFPELVLWLPKQMGYKP